jgi:hypothetical protein
MKDKIIVKLTSRKFLMFLAAFCTALGAGLTNCVDGTTSLACVIISAVGYGISEALPDMGGAFAQQSQVITANSTSVTATSASQKVVEKALAPDPKEV